MLRRLLVACLLALAPIAAGAAEFTPAQRAEIVRIVRDALKNDPSILRDAIETLQADDNARDQVATRDAIAKVQNRLVTPADPVAGDAAGDVTIVEFFDTRCPYCKRLESAMDDVLAKDKKVKLVLKDLPILGPNSVTGSKALLAAQNQGGYLKLRTAIMKLPSDAGLPQIEAAARAEGLDVDRLKKDMDDPAIQTRLDTNLALAHELGIQGTPALVIGNTLIPGALSAPELEKAVNEARHS